MHIKSIRIEHRPPDAIIPECTIIGTINYNNDQKALLVWFEPDGQSGWLQAVDPEKQFPVDGTAKDIEPHLIRALIHDQSQTQLAFALETGFHLDTVKRWLAGSRRPPLGVVKLILKARGLIGRDEQ